MCRLLLVFGFLLVCVSPASADWINLTGAETSPNIAEIYVEEDRVRIVLEIYIGDLETFAALVPDEWLTDMVDERPSLQERLEEFAAQTLQVTTGEGERLPARLVAAEARLRTDRRSPFSGMINPYTRQRVPEPPADKRVLYAEIEYPFEGRPENLSFVPPLDAEGRPQVSMGFIVYHKSVPVIDFRYLGAKVRLSLDWKDPWYSKFDNPNLKRHHKSALMSFLYVEPYEVRHEVLTRVKDLETWMDLGLRGEEYIELDELEPLLRRIGQFFLGRNPVLVDGVALKPILDRSNYVRVALTGIRLIEKPQRLELATAMVGIIITYVTDGIPDEVTVDWDLFNEQIQRVPATATDPAGPLPTYLTPDDNLHTWTNYLKTYRLPGVESVAVSDSLGRLAVPWLSITGALLMVPVGVWAVRRSRSSASLAVPVITLLALVLVSVLAYPSIRLSVARPAGMAVEMSSAQAAELLQVLLKNVYRAFDFREEADVYDKLALSVDGDLLTEIYLQNRRALTIRNAGGAKARIKSVEIQEAAAEALGDGSLGYTIKGRWTAQGSVGHWGHIHTRRNQYEALIRLEPFDGAWKITGMKVLEERRIDPAAAGNPPTGNQ